MRVASSALHAFAAHDGRAGVVVALRDREGRVGLGEAAALTGFVPDDAPRARAVLVAALARLGELGEEGPVGATVDAALEPLAGVLALAPSARFALETALLDLAARRRGVPLRVALGGPRPYVDVAVNGLVPGHLTGDAIVARASLLASRGLRAVKVKLRARGDAAFALELAALARVREALPDLELRLDPNAAWSLEEAPRRLAALAPVRPRYVEQPVAPGLLARLGAVAVPIAADESLADPAEADALLAADACAAYVLKPAHVGGLVRALALAARAQGQGRDVVVTHAFDGPVGFAAACELALSLPRAPLACGLDPDGALSVEDAARLAQLAAPGHVRGVDAPGLALRWPA